MKVKDILDILSESDCESELTLSVDVESINPEHGRRIFCSEMVELIEDAAGNLTLCVLGEWNPE